MMQYIIAIFIIVSAITNVILMFQLGDAKTRLTELEKRITAAAYILRNVKYESIQKHVENLSPESAYMHGYLDSGMFSLADYIHDYKNPVVTQPAERK